MKVLRIETTDAAAEQKSFKGKGIKLNKSGLKIKKPLVGDTFELRKSLPDNKTAKEHKYFGPPEGDGPYEASTADIIVAGGAVAIGIALALL